MMDEVRNAGMGIKGVRTRINRKKWLRYKFIGRLVCDWKMMWKMSKLT